MSEKSLKNRNFAFEIYQDSCPCLDNLIMVLNDLHVPGCISPWHDKDFFLIDSEEHKKGDLKKPHRHILFSFNGNKTIKQILFLVEPLGAKFVLPVYNLPAMVRYFAHLDNPEKAQYSPADIIGFGGFDVQKYLYSGETLYKEVSSMLALISKEKYSYQSFLDFIAIERKQWFALVVEHGNINNMVRGYCHNIKNVSTFVDTKSYAKKAEQDNF